MSLTMAFHMNTRRNTTEEKRPGRAAAAEVGGQTGAHSRTGTLSLSPGFFTLNLDDRSSYSRWRLYLDTEGENLVSDYYV